LAVLDILKYFGKRGHGSGRQVFSKKNGRKFFTNFFTRLLYLWFLEVLICGLLHLSITSVFKSGPGIINWIFELLIVLTLGGFTVFVFSLLFKNGPKLENFWFGSALMSYFRIRDFNKSAGNI
jgi:hypothetical protein